MDTAISHDGIHATGSIVGIRMSYKEPVFSAEGSRSSKLKIRDRLNILDLNSGVI